MIGMDPPRHDRIKGLFQRGFTPRRIAEHEPMIRTIAGRWLDEISGREVVDLVHELAAPIVGRVIGSFLGTPQEDDATWSRLSNKFLSVGDEELQEDDAETMQAFMGMITRILAFAAERREHPTGDLTSVLVQAEIDGQGLEDYEIAMGFAILVAAGNDSTRSTFTSGMRAVLENPELRARLVADPARIPAAIEEFLRLYPAFAHFRRTATRDVELHGKTIHKGDKVLIWLVASNRDESIFQCPHELDLDRNHDHQAFGAGGRHFCLGSALARLELRVLFEETLARFPDMEIAEPPRYGTSPFIPQLRELRVRLRP